MKKKWLALICAFAAAGTGVLNASSVCVNADAAEKSGTVYYVSSRNGDNANTGTSENEAWETLDHLKSVSLKPGDEILLEKGSEFYGFIHLKDVHGRADAPIKIGSYGTAESRPVIHADGQGIWYQSYGNTMDNRNHRSKGYVSSAILLYDVDFVEISGLELTNRSDDFTYFKGAASSASEIDDRMDRTGVSGIAKDGGTMEHIYLNDLYIHDVDGNIEDKHMNNGGIQMNVLPPANEAETGIARYHDVKVTNCHVKDVSRAGICVGYTYQGGRFNGSAISDETAKTYGHTNLLIEGNYVQDVGNDGIVAMYAYRPLIQRNVSDKAGADLEIYTAEKTPEEYRKFWQPFCAAIWPWKCKDAVFQYNEVFDTVDSQDGQPWDVDWSDGTVYQYNYSHNNGGGCIMICGAEAYRGIFRYNISQNDLKGLIALADANPKAEISNNVFYIGNDLNTKLFIDKSNYNGTAELRNNIFYNVSTKKTAGETIVKARRSFTNNIFYGYDGCTLPEGSITADPKFENPGGAPVNSASGALHDQTVYEGYRLQENSPAINAGVLSGRSAKYDFFGNPVGAQPDIGVFESDTAESVLALGGDLVTVENGRITDVPEGMTAAWLKEQLIYARDVEIRIVKDGKDIPEEDVVPAGAAVVIARDGKTVEYTLNAQQEAGYLDYEQTSMTVSAGSAEDGSSEWSGPEYATPASNVLDGDENTIWCSRWDDADQTKLWLLMDLKTAKPVARLTYVPRKSGTSGIFTKYRIEVSENGQAWTEAAAGTWSGDSTVKYAAFQQVNARYVKITAVESIPDNNKAMGTAAEIRIGYQANASGQ